MIQFCQERTNFTHGSSILLLQSYWYRHTIYLFWLIRKKQHILFLMDCENLASDHHGTSWWTSWNMETGNNKLSKLGIAHYWPIFNRSPDRILFYVFNIIVCLFSCSWVSLLNIFIYHVPMIIDDAETKIRIQSMHSNKWY